MPEPDPTTTPRTQPPDTEQRRHPVWIKPLDNDAAQHACAWLLFAGFGYIACAALRHTTTETGLPLASMLSLSISIASIGCAIAARRIAHATTTDEPAHLIAQTVRNARPLILCALAIALASASAEIAPDEPIAASLLAAIAAGALPVAWLSRTATPPAGNRPSSDAQGPARSDANGVNR